ncbi:MAG TPA: hypothetical protein QF873_02520 [Patescibacteria group bacterium]|nr:hypothetical protein [Patescibacteria group bacterium]
MNPETPGTPEATAITPEATAEASATAEAVELTAESGETRDSKQEFPTNAEVEPGELQNLFDGPVKAFTRDSESGEQILDVEATREAQGKYVESFLADGPREWDKIAKAVLGDKTGDSVFHRQSFEKSAGIELPSIISTESLPLAVGPIKEHLLHFAASQVKAEMDLEKLTGIFKWIAEQDAPEGQEDAAVELQRYLEGYEKELDQLKKEGEVIAARANETPAEQWEQVASVDHPQRTEVWESLSPEEQAKIEQQ